MQIGLWNEGLAPVPGPKNGLALALFLPLIQIDTCTSGFTWSVDREEGLNAFAFTADGERVENLVPAFWSFF